MALLTSTLVRRSVGMGCKDTNFQAKESKQESLPLRGGLQKTSSKTKPHTRHRKEPNCDGSYTLRFNLDLMKFTD